MSSKKIFEIMKENKVSTEVLLILSKLNLSQNSTLEELYDAVEKISNPVEKLEILFQISKYLTPSHTDRSTNFETTVPNKRNITRNFTASELDEIYRRILSLKTDIVKVMYRSISKLDYPDEVLRDYVKNKLFNTVIVPLEKKEGVYVVQLRYTLGELYYVNDVIRELIEEIIDDIMYSYYHGLDSGSSYQV